MATNFLRRFRNRGGPSRSGVAPVSPASRHTSDASPGSPAPQGRNCASPVPVGRGNSVTTGSTPMAFPVLVYPESTSEAPPRVNNIATPGAEDALELLRLYDVVFLVDDSESMSGALWSEAGAALAEVARAASRYDDDGIDIYFLNSKENGKSLGSSDAVRALFARVRPRGVTPTGARLDSLLRSYLSIIERAQHEHGSTDPEVTGIKPISYIVITDGAPTDDPESVVVAAAQRLDRGEFPLSQLGIQFVQIGNDPEAAAALAELDDDLSGRYGVRDIVDTTPYTSRLDGETLIKILLGGVNKRVDRRGGAAVLR